MPRADGVGVPVMETAAVPRRPPRRTPRPDADRRVAVAGGYACPGPAAGYCPADPTSLTALTPSAWAEATKLYEVPCCDRERRHLDLLAVEDRRLDRGGRHERPGRVGRVPELEGRRRAVGGVEDHLHEPPGSTTLA